MEYYICREKGKAVLDAGIPHLIASGALKKENVVFAIFVVDKLTYVLLELLG